MKRSNLNVVLKIKLKFPLKSLELARERGTNDGDSSRLLMYIGVVRKYYPGS
jgi:hypothetical protein